MNYIPYKLEILYKKARRNFRPAVRNSNWKNINNRITPEELYCVESLYYPEIGLLQAMCHEKVSNVLITNFALKKIQRFQVFDNVYLEMTYTNEELIEILGLHPSVKKPLFLDFSNDLDYHYRLVILLSNSLPIPKPIQFDLVYFSCLNFAFKILSKKWRRHLSRHYFKNITLLRHRFFCLYINGLDIHWSKLYLYE